MTSTVAVPAVLAAPETPAPETPAPGAAAPKLRFRSYLGYAAGDAGNNLAFSMTSMFLLLYYTDVVGISAAAAGTLFLVVRVWDAFADIWAGRQVDKTMTRWGKFRPFFLFGSLPLLLLSVATFTVPGGLGGTGKLIYAYLTYALLGLAYSLVNIPYGSLASAMTQEPVERARLASFRSMGTAATIIALAFIVAPQIKSSDNLQQSLTLTTLLFVVFGFGLYMLLFSTSKERVVRTVAHVSLKQSLATLKGNRPLLMLCLSALSFLVGMFTLQTVQAYYARDVLGDANYFIVLTLVSTGVMFVVAGFIPRIVRAVGKKPAYLASSVVAIVAAVGIALTPSTLPGLAIAFFGLYGVGLAAVNTLMWALEADTVEYGEWRTGVRTEGTTYAVFSFTRKVGQAVGGAAAAFGLGIVGYVAHQDVQSQATQDGIRYIAGFVPAAFILVGVVIMVFYPLTETRFRAMVADVAARRAAQEG
ncbi:glucuronide transporter [Cellulomonas chitinilytica]|uniref:Glucuronide transporter n=1 Tax=Cellulomonas chitinilytica TaxID=398759 RepID=A0A919TZ37_9CELL|nr:glucuronide transporter [Cellulomonas chitinilytica]GIG20438.1 glucuronide transporter [Cellulomonas chitinilytica]